MKSFKILIVSLFSFIFTSAVYAGTWSSPVQDGFEQYNPTITTAAIRAAANGYGPAETPVSGSCVTGQTHTYYTFQDLVVTRPPVGNRSVVRFWRQVCN